MQWVWVGRQRWCKVVVLLLHTQAATEETVLPVRKRTNTARPQQNSSALSGVAGNNSRKHWYPSGNSKGTPSSLTGKTGNYFSTAP